MEGLTRLQEHRLELQHRLDMHRTMEMPPSPSPSSRSLAPFSSASSSLSEGSNQPSGEDSASIVTGIHKYIRIPGLFFHDISFSLSLSLYLSIYLSFSPSVAPDRENTHAHEERERERERECVLLLRNRAHPSSLKIPPPPPLERDPRRCTCVWDTRSVIPLMRHCERARERGREKEKARNRCSRNLLCIWRDSNVETIITIIRNGKAGPLLRRIKTREIYIRIF